MNVDEWLTHLAQATARPPDAQPLGEVVQDAARSLQAPGAGLQGLSIRPTTTPTGAKISVSVPPGSMVVGRRAQGSIVREQILDEIEDRLDPATDKLADRAVELL